MASAELYRQALRLDSTFALAEAHLARVNLFLAHQGEPAAVDSGLAIARRAIAKDPSEAYGHFALGDLLMMAGRTADVRLAFARALEMAPNLAPSAADLACEWETVWQRGVGGAGVQGALRPVACPVKALWGRQPRRQTLCRGGYHGR